MLQRLKSEVRHLLTPFAARPSPEEQVARALQQRFDSSEVILVCFPKCGSTWLEIMLTQYLIGRYGATARGVRDLHDVSKTLPSVAVTWRTHDHEPHLKTAERFETDKTEYAQKHVIFLVRDPRDVVVSYFFEYTKKKEYLAAGEPPFTGTIDDFVYHKIGGLRAVVRFFNIWAENRGTPREFSLLTYEDLHRNTVAEVTRIADIIDRNPIDPACIEKAVTFGAFENMRKLEEQNAPGLRLNPNVRLGDTEGYKVRKGKIAGYRDYLSAHTIAEAEQIIRGELSDFYHFYKT
jgi:hypothetical protein